MTDTIPSNTSTITALLIDPLRAEARRVMLTLKDAELVLAELYALIGCELVECCRSTIITWSGPTRRVGIRRRPSPPSMTAPMP
jgi:hypothetical protein